MNSIQSRQFSVTLALLASLLLGATLSASAWSEETPQGRQGGQFRAEPQAPGSGQGGEQRVAPRPHGGGPANGGSASNGARSEREHYRGAQGGGFNRVSPGYQRYGYRGQSYYYNGGIWYRPGGYGYDRIRPPRGLLIYSLPLYYSTRWYGGVPYYYYEDSYYLWDPVQRGYVVTEPPEAPASNAPDGDSADVYVYPMQNQTPEQQSKDRYECYRWAANQTGFDPTKVEGGVSLSTSGGKAEAYRRAETACLTGRGYSVK
jgi:hypothetical protein